MKFEYLTSGFSNCQTLILQQYGHLDATRVLLRAGANVNIRSRRHGTAREIAERRGRVEIILAMDRHECRKTLVDLCIGLYAADFPVLVVLEIHDALCLVNGLHEAEFGEETEWRSLPEGHFTGSVSWEIAKKVKHNLD